MAIGGLAKAVSLAWTLPSSPASTITKILDYSADDPSENDMVAMQQGNARVDSHYQGKLTGKISIVTTDAGKSVLVRKGMVFTALILTVAASVEANGTATGTTATYTMSKAIVLEIEPVSHTNGDDAPGQRRITFGLHRADGDTDDPTYTYTAGS